MRATGSLFAVLLAGGLAAGVGATAPRDAAGAAARVQAPNLDPNAAETKAHRDARMGWWREARFGMFIHWGLYAQPAGEWKGVRQRGIGEWIMHDLKIPVADYAEIAKTFDPVRFDADVWVGIAKAAGMKYIVMTSKHHDGFAMFHSTADSFNIFDATPFKRDPIAEMAAAAARQGLKFGVYYSQAQDWHHPGGAAYSGGHWDPAQDGDLHQYVRTVAAPQVTELLTRYHPAILWWDTPVDMSPEDIKALTAAFAADPTLISNNRLGNGVPGDTETPEQSIPARGFPGRDWETCMTINDTWGYKSFDTNFKTTARLIQNLVDIASKGGNYLLNVGPDPAGVIPQPEVDRLAGIGAWLRRNGESIYATSASPYKRLPFDGRATVRDRTLYLNVFTWPPTGVTLAGLKTDVRDAVVLDTGERLKVERSLDGTLSISIPSLADPVSTAIAIHLFGAPVVVEPEFVAAPETNGVFRLSAADATLNGGTLQLENGRPGNIGFWTNASDSVEWRLRSPAGSFAVSLEYACQPGSEGSAFEIVVDGAATGVTGVVARTNSWQSYTTLPLEGTLRLDAGLHTIRVRPRSKPGTAVMNLRSVTLTPATDDKTAVVVDAAVAYVTQYEQKLTSLLATEVSAQRIVRQIPAASGPTSRTLDSEIFFMFSPAGHEWMAVRDVSAVDRRPVQDPPDLKAALSSLPFVQVAPTLKSYSSRFNLGRIVRNFGEPTLSLLVLDANHRADFAFSQTRVQRQAGTVLVTLAFRETGSSTLIHDLSGRPAPSEGELIVEAASGRVRQAVLRARMGSVQAELTTVYSAEPRLGLWVPSAFRERYDDGVAPAPLRMPANYERVECESKYSNFRRFEVTARIK